MFWICVWVVNILKKANNLQVDHLQDYLRSFFVCYLIQKMEFTTGEEMESKEVGKNKVLTGEELSKQLDRLLQDKANNQRIRDWVEVCDRARDVSLQTWIFSAGLFIQFKR